MHQHTSKVFLDSRYTLPDGEFEIPGGGIELSPNSRCWLAELTCVAAWDTLDGTNSILYVREGAALRTVQLATGPHDMESIRAELETKLNGAGKNVSMGVYSVTRASTGSGGATFRALQVACTSGVFSIPSDDVVRTLWGVEPNSTNSLFSFPTGDAQAPAHTSTFVDLRRVHSIYVHSYSFGNYNAVGPRGERTIMAKIPVDVAYGSLVNWQASGSEHDFIECGVRSLKTLRLQLRDVAGRQIDLKGTRWSAALVFER